MFNYKEVECWEDMLPYKDVYQGVVRDLNKRFSEKLIIVELGIRAGVSSRILYEALKYGTTGGFEMTLIDPIRHHQTKIFDGFPEVTFIKGTAEENVGRFEAESIHLLHIDVDPHVYEQTLDLFNRYNMKIKEQGVIIFHDCSEKFGVKKAVEEITLISHWVPTYPAPHPDSPESVPAIVRKDK